MLQGVQTQHVGPQQTRVVHHGIVLGIIDNRETAHVELHLELQVLVSLGGRHHDETGIGVLGKRDALQFLRIAVLIGIACIYPLHSLIAREGNLQHALLAALRARHHLIGLERDFRLIDLHNGVNSIFCYP